VTTDVLAARLSFAAEGAARGALMTGLLVPPLSQDPGLRKGSLLRLQSSATLGTGLACQIRVTAKAAVLRLHGLTAHAGDFFTAFRADFAEAFGLFCFHALTFCCCRLQQLLGTLRLGTG
jgi:hypothetical protein